MATKTIDELTAAAAGLTTQEIEIYDPAGSPKSQKLTIAKLIALIRTPDFTSGLLTQVGNQSQVAHGLGVVPRLVRCVAVVGAAANGYSVGDEIDASSFWDQVDQAVPTIIADATHLTVNIDFSGANIFTKDGSTLNQPTGSMNLQAKFYAWK